MITQLKQSLPAISILLFVIVYTTSFVFGAALPTPFNIHIIISLFVLPVVWGMLYFFTRFKTMHEHEQQQAKLSKQQIAIEITLLIVAVFIVGRDYLPYDPTTRLHGIEAEWLTGYVAVAHDGLRDTGTIPLWNPYYRMGEPLVDNAVSFILNPLSSIPSLLFGHTQGVKWSVAIHLIFVTIGGWYLGTVLKLGFAGRIMLALLLLGKGNMLANLKTGYYQLAIQQAYFPWITAATIQVMQRKHRTPIILLAVMMTLILFTGNVWYALPMAFNVGIIALIYGIKRLSIDWRAWFRMGIATLIALGLSAAYILPIALQYDHLGGHPDIIQAGYEIVDRIDAFKLYFEVDFEVISKQLTLHLPDSDLYSGSWINIHYNYTSPLWYFMLLFLVFPIIMPSNLRIQKPNWRIWLIGIVVIIVMVMWSMGGTPLFLWLYDQIPIFRGWRFVGRATAVASFWLAIFIAMRTDQISRILRVLYWRNQQLKYLTHSIFLLVAGIAVSSVLGQWLWQGTNVLHRETYIDTCFQRYRQDFPHAYTPVWMGGYETITPYIDHNIRLTHIEADFVPLPDNNTIGAEVLSFRDDLPEYALQHQLTTMKERYSLQSLDYHIWAYSPYVEGQACLYHNANRSRPYAFTVPFNQLNEQTSWEELRTIAQPVANYKSIYDTVGVLVEPTDVQQILIVSETAYPGWGVSINGEKQPLQIVGGFIAVLLPSSDTQQQVIFAYRPPLLYIGGILTIITAIGCIILLTGRKPFPVRSSAQST